MNTATAAGVELAYDSFGRDADEAILLISGLGAQRIRWTTPFCEDLASRGFRVIRFDNRDAGGSTHLRDCPAPDFGALAAALEAGRRPDVPYALADMAADAVGLFDASRIERAHVVGRSMGGMIAQILASEYPERVRSLTSIMSSTGNPALAGAEPEVMALMRRPSPDPFLDETAFLAHSVAFARRIAGAGFDEQAHRQLVLEETRRAYDPAGVARQLAAMALAGDRRSRLATIAAPTLVIHGTDDPLIPPAGGRDTADTIPNADFLLIDGMGHDLPAAQERRVCEAIEATARAAL